MRVSRLLLAALLVTLCAAPSVAQSPASPQDRFSSSPLLSGQAPTYHLRSQPIVPFVKDGAARGQGQMFQGFKVPNLLDQPAATRTWTVLTGKLSTPPPLTQRCYTLRQYQFEQDDPRSDVTRFKDYSACQPSGQVHLKGATASPSR